MLMTDKPDKQGTSGIMGFIEDHAQSLLIM
jgi:hypothetical protein